MARWIFDLDLAHGDGVYDLSCLIFEASAPEDARIIGPFPVGEAIAPIVDALAAVEGMFPDRDRALDAVAAANSAFRQTGVNRAGKPYPRKVGT